MFKILGAFITVGICTIFGFKFSAEKRKNLTVIEDLIYSLTALSQLIECTMEPLPDALRKSGRGEAAVIFTRIANKEIEGSEYEYLKSEVKKAVKDFADGLTAESKEGQKANISLCMERLKASEKNAREDYLKSEKLYKSGGILAGILITLILL
ncbi:MAG: stage III sporulation protein AB [Bacillota bacterium]|nr:stage III sporulation protein AB [Bacillota bacterium]